MNEAMTPLLIALIVALFGIIGVLLTAILRGKKGPDTSELIHTVAEAIGAAFEKAISGTSGAKDPAYWERYFDAMENRQDSLMRGQGHTHARIDKLTELHGELLAKIDRLCEVWERK